MINLAGDQSGRTYNLNNERPDAKERRTRIIWILLFSLFIVFSLSSYIIGFQVGKTVDKVWYTGNIIDTINISFGYRSSVPQPIYQIDIRGQVFYEDGTPYAGGDVELHSSVKYAVTDELGFFEFFNVEEGNHTIYVIKDNEILAQCDILAERSEGITSLEITEFEKGKYRIKIPIMVTIVDIILEISRDGEDGPVNIFLNPVQPKQPEIGRAHV